MAYSNFSTTYPALNKTTLSNLPTEVQSNIRIARDLTAKAITQARTANELISCYRTYRSEKVRIIDLFNRSRSNFLIVYAILGCIQHMHPFLLHWFNSVIKTLSILPTFHPFH
jgi:hypothetical protein